jgi:hypothetical protein
LIIRYFNNTYCKNCLVNLLIEDDKGKCVEQIKNSDTFEPLSVSSIEIINYKKKHGSQYFELYYYEKSIKSKTLLFKVILD